MAATPGLFTVVSAVGQADPTAWLKDVDYQLCTSVAQLDAYVAEAERTKAPVAIDWETTSLNVYDPLRLLDVGMSISTAPSTALYCPLAHLTDPHLNLPRLAVIAVLQRLDAAGCPLVFYNYMYDGEVMAVRFTWEPTHWEDAMIGVWLANSNQKAIGLKGVARRLFGITLLEYGQVTGGQSFAYLSPHDAVPYACGDADLTRRIWLHDAVREAVRAQPVIYQIEKNLIGVVRRGIRHGVYLDLARLDAMHHDIGAEVTEKKGSKKIVLEPMRPDGMLAKTRDEIFALAGGPFELNSPQKLGQKLVEMGVPIEERTEKTKQVETGKEVLAKYAAKYPICAAVSKFRELQTQDTNYIEKMRVACVRFEGHVRFPFKTMGAPTGRMSAGGEGDKERSADKGVVNVNIQSLPDPDKQPYLPNIRAAIVANDPTTDDDAWVIVSIDYKQLQMRIVGNLSKEPAWIKSFANGEDIHLTNAKLAYDNPHLTAEDERARDRGKTMGFAVLFGATETTVAEHGGIGVKAAKHLIDTFMGNAYTLGQWILGTQLRAQTEKRVTTYFGRVRRLDEYYAPDAPRWLRSKGDREAVNTLAQGGEADVFKHACYLVQQLVDGLGATDDWHQILWVHDELVSRVRRSRVAELTPAVMQAMTFPVKGWPITLAVSAKVGWDWGTGIPLAAWTTDPPPKPARVTTVQQEEKPHAENEAEIEEKNVVENKPVLAAVPPVYSTEQDATRAAPPGLIADPGAEDW